ncbi:MAG TPA: HAD-IIB family hydrolase, partial [Candidatus Microsaccharimonas sp.]|nr:HAD-IIB family hydrolase [Candidatus Microsaccharimonas sp.]
MILFATDLDGSLVGDDAAMQKLFGILQPLREQGKLKFVYVSGRSYERIKRQQPEENLAQPDAIIASVGSEIYINDSLVAGWQDSFSTGWNRDAIAKTAAEFTNLTFQEESEQRPYKISFESDVPNKAEVLRLSKALTKEFPNIQVLSSHAGQYVDIMPTGSDKGSAVLYLAKLWNIHPEDIYSAGDSSNDITMLEKTKAIVVGNAYKELHDWYDDHPG